MKYRLLSIAIYLVSASTGILALLYPFFLPSLVKEGYSGLRTSEMPLMMTVLLALCLLVLLVEAQGRAANARLVALLGVLVAINSALRFLETAIPGPGGFSPIFFLIILSGYVYGGRFGFLMGALTLLVSAFITGGVGPWLPGQMFTAGWVGLSAPLARVLVGMLGRGQQGEVWWLALFAGLWGFLFGALMNLWTWPFIAGSAEQSWSAGIGLLETLRRYGLYYLFTSLAWDAIAAAGNTLLLLAFGAPALRALRRFRERFDYFYLPEPQATGQTRGGLD
ncbi:MAG: ECF transporter S component [Anaerolineales bacterium]|nr:ECF transporter S component [Anaerolineales bacterium]